MEILIIVVVCLWLYASHRHKYRKMVVRVKYDFDGEKPELWELNLKGMTAIKKMKAGFGDHVVIYQCAQGLGPNGVRYMLDNEAPYMFSAIVELNDDQTENVIY